MTAQELIARLSPDRDVVLRIDAEYAGEMLLQQAEQIEALTKMLVISDDTHQTWMKANAPRGWIDDLRIERDALIALSEQLTRERDALKADAERVRECAARLVEHADFKLGGILSAGSKSKDIPSKATSQVKSRHLAALRDALKAIDAMKGTT